MVSGKWMSSERKRARRVERKGGEEGARGRQSGMVRFKSPQMNIYIFH